MPRLGLFFNHDGPGRLLVDRAHGLRPLAARRRRSTEKGRVVTTTNPKSPVMSPSRRGANVYFEPVEKLRSRKGANGEQQRPIGFVVAGFRKKPKGSQDGD